MTRKRLSTQLRSGVTLCASERAERRWGTSGRATPSKRRWTVTVLTVPLLIEGHFPAGSAARRTLFGEMGRARQAMAA